MYGYLPYWELNRASARTIDYGSLSTIAFFAIRVTGSGALDRKTPGYRAYVSSAAAAVTNAAHQRGVRVVPTFQLFDSGRFSTLRRLLGSRRAQDAFINQALGLMSHFVPPDSMGIVRKVVSDVVTPNRGAFLSFGVLGTLWAASGGF